jgi:hypothetical protein
MNSTNNAGVAERTFLTGTREHDEFIARIKEVYTGFPRGSKITYGRLARAASMNHQTVKKMFTNYPSALRHIEVKQSHYAGR